jgi:hypothetical protein
LEKVFLTLAHVALLLCVCCVEFCFVRQPPLEFDSIRGHAGS